MAIVMKKKKNESIASLLRRFTRRVQQSRVLMEVRKRRFRKPEQTEREKKISALHRAAKKKEIEKLKKLGKYEKSGKYEKTSAR